MALKEQMLNGFVTAAKTCGKMSEEEIGVHHGISYYQDATGSLIIKHLCGCGRPTKGTNKHSTMFRNVRLNTCNVERFSRVQTLILNKDIIQLMAQIEEGKL